MKPRSAKTSAAKRKNRLAAKPDYRSIAILGWRYHMRGMQSWRLTVMHQYLYSIPMSGRMIAGFHN